MSKSWLIHIDNLFAPWYWLIKSVASTLPQKPQNSSKPILIIKFFGMGSIVRIIDVVEHIHPKPQVTFITLSANKPLLDSLKYQGVYLSMNPLISIPKFLLFMIKVWSGSFLIVDCERKSNVSGIMRELLALGKPKVYFDFGKSYRSASTTIIDLKKQSAVESLQLALGSIGKSMNRAMPNLSEIKTVLVNINAGHYLPERKYPKEHFKNVVIALAKNHEDWTFNFSGLQSEMNEISSIIDSLELSNYRVRNLAGTQTLSEFINFIKQVDLIITNDSSPLHWANYFGIRCVAIWGPTSSEKVGYPDSSLMKNISLKVECSPCFNHPKSKVAEHCAGKIFCLNELAPEVVANTIESWIREHEPQQIRA